MKKKMRQKDLLGFDDRIPMLILVPIMAFWIPILFFGEPFPFKIAAYLPMWSISLLYTAAYYLSVRGIILALRKRFNGPQLTGQRIKYTFLLLAPAYLILNGVIDFIYHQLIDRYCMPEPDAFQANVASITVIALCWAIYESIFMYTQWYRSVVETERLQKEFIQSQYEGLRNQVNPHFLFNSLNTLAYIIPEDPQRGVKFVEKLAKVYRYVLEIQDRRLIPLEEELEFLESYIFLHQERFGKNLRVDMVIPAELRSSLVVPLATQLLFENAIKHNIIAQDRPLHITLLAQPGQLTVRNNFQPRHQKEPSTKIGLDNIRNRYAYFTHEPVEVNQTDQYFTVTIPLISAPVLVA